MKMYKSKGFVSGNLWGGGQGFYPAEELINEKLSDLKKEIKKGIEEGWLDSGMGFESLNGAVIEIMTIRTIKKGDKSYVNNSYKVLNFGLSKKEFDNGKEFLNN